MGPLRSCTHTSCGASDPACTGRAHHTRHSGMWDPLQDRGQGGERESQTPTPGSIGSQRPNPSHCSRTSIPPLPPGCSDPASFQPLSWLLRDAEVTGQIRPRWRTSSLHRGNTEQCQTPPCIPSGHCGFKEALPLSGEGSQAKCFVYELGEKRRQNSIAYNKLLSSRSNKLKGAAIIKFMRQHPEHSAKPNN